MNKDQLATLVADKIDAAIKSGEHPKKFFVTENGRGVVDGGDLYNAVFADVLSVVKVALVDILQEAIPAPQPAPAPKAAPAPQPAPAPIQKPASKIEKPSRASTRK